MSESIDKEVVRLVKEIKEDEYELVRYERYGMPDKAIIYEKAIDRKMRLLRLLKEEAK